MIAGRGRRTARIAAAIGAFLLTVSFSACSTVTTPDQSSAVIGDYVVDPAAKLSISPVDYGEFSLVSAQFGVPVKGRPVSLQHRVENGWEEVATAPQNKSGAADFKVKLEPSGTYRAVALPIATSGGLERPPAATPDTSAGQQWKVALETEFDGKKLDIATWDYRSTGSYDATGRQCSAPYPENVRLADGKVALSVTEETDPARIAAADAAGCAESGHYVSAMISTEGRFTLKTGIVAARVKFPQGQGMHGSVWLQSGGGSEIDFVESYGYGRGLTSVIHVDGQRYPKKNKDTYVNTQAVKDRAWWDEYHVYSVEWDYEELVFRIDGIETQRIQQATPDVDYFVVVSMLSSDWEQKRFKKPVQNAEGVTPATLPQTMKVDWVKVWTPA